MRLHEHRAGDAPLGHPSHPDEYTPVGTEEERWIAVLNALTTERALHDSEEHAVTCALHKNVVSMLARLFVTAAGGGTENDYRGATYLAEQLADKGQFVLQELQIIGMHAGLVVLATEGKPLPAPYTRPEPAVTGS